MSWYRDRLTSVNDSGIKNDWFFGVLDLGRVYKKYYDMWLAVNNDYMVTCEVIKQYIWVGTTSLVEIIGESPHSWPWICR